LAFAQTLPVIARANQLYQSNLLRQQSNAALAKARGDLMSRVPGLTQQIYSQLLNQEIQKAVAQKSFAASIFGQQSANQRATAAQQAAYNRLVYGQEQQNQRTVYTQGAIGGRQVYQNEQENIRNQKRIDAANMRAANALKARGMGGAKMRNNIYTKAVQIATAYRTGGSGAVTQDEISVLAGLAPQQGTRLDPNHAVVGIMSYLRHYYPNAPHQWIYTYALSILSTAGYTGPNIRNYQGLAEGGTKPPKKKKNPYAPGNPLNPPYVGP